MVVRFGFVFWVGGGCSKLDGIVERGVLCILCVSGEGVGVVCGIVCCCLRCGMVVDGLLLWVFIGVLFGVFVGCVYVGVDVVFFCIWLDMDFVFIFFFLLFVFNWE